MRKKFQRIGLFLVGCIYFILSCKKEYSCEGCNEKNKPPIAVAGLDQTITLPADSVLLDGSASSDPDGMISSYLWKKISGPASFSIIKLSDSITKVKSLVAGVYLFELKITDNGGLLAKDTVQITVNATVTTNHPPVATAGPDQVITLPINTVTLNGSASTDPDNNITSYLWAKISGPSSFTIANASAVQTQVTNLVQGVYQFELKVTDAGGLFSKDTMQVTVNPQPTLPNCVQFIPFGSLAFTGYVVKTAAAGNKILFSSMSTVSIYDTLTQTWSTVQLSMERYGYAVSTAGNKIFFAGGDEGQGFGFGYTRVDIYDVSTNTWSTAELSQGRSRLASASVGSKVYFGGGYSYDYGISDIVDIYDIPSNTWSIAHLSDARVDLSAVSLNSKIYFAGGRSYSNISNRVDIYDTLTNSWSITTIAEPKSEMATIAVDNKIIWAGGMNMLTPPFASNLADIYDVNTGNHTLHQMSGIPNSAYNNNVAASGNKIIFLTQTANNFKANIYDISTQTWSVCENLTQPTIAALVTSGNLIFGALSWINGNYTNQVWKLEF